MKIKDAFKKLENYNELADLMRMDKMKIWFADVSICVSIGDHFASYDEFRKYIRHEYVKNVADQILNSDGWDLNEEKEIISASGNEMTFELSLSVA